jgi:hypothetical protein
VGCVVYLQGRGNGSHVGKTATTLPEESSCGGPCFCTASLFVHATVLHIRLHMSATMALKHTSACS